MIRFTFIGCVFCLMFSFCLAQNDSCGIYLSANDFSCNKLSFVYNTNHKGSYINSNDIFHDRYVVIRQNGSRFKILKDSIYGIKYPDGTVTRMYHLDEYTILNVGEPILLYSKISGPGDKGETAVTTYYFSPAPDAEPLSLSLVNIQLVFANNKEFLREVNRSFSTDEDLLRYDPVAKMRLINYLFIQISQTK